MGRRYHKMPAWVAVLAAGVCTEAAWVEEAEVVWDEEQACTVAWVGVALACTEALVSACSWALAPACTGALVGVALACSLAWELASCTEAWVVVEVVSSVVVAVVEASWVWVVACKQAALVGASWVVVVACKAACWAFLVAVVLACRLALVARSRCWVLEG